MEQVAGYLHEAVGRTRRFASNVAARTGNSSVSVLSSDVASRSEDAMEVDGEKTQQAGVESLDSLSRIEFHHSEVFPYKVRKPTERELEALRNLQLSSKAQEAALAVLEGGKSVVDGFSSSSSTTNTTATATDQPLVLSVGPEALAAYAAASAGRKKRKRSSLDEVFAEVNLFRPCYSPLCHTTDSSPHVSGRCARSLRRLSSGKLL